MMPTARVTEILFTSLTRGYLYWLVIGCPKSMATVKKFSGSLMAVLFNLISLPSVNSYCCYCWSGSDSLAPAAPLGRCGVQHISPPGTGSHLKWIHLSHCLTGFEGIH